MTYAFVRARAVSPMTLPPHSIRVWLRCASAQPPMQFGQRLAVALFALLVLLAAVAPSAALADAWPALTHPQDARIEPVGERVRVNGVPMRLTRVITTLPADAAAAHYQRALGAPVAHA